VRPECGRSTSAEFLLPAFVITELRKSLRPEANFGMGPAKREAGSNFSSVARGESPVTSVQFTTEPGQARIAARPSNPRERAAVESELAHSGREIRK